MNKEHVFKIINNYESPDFVYPTVTMEIDSEATLGDMLDAFSSFLNAVGYYVPNKSRLDFIIEQENEEI